MAHLLSELLLRLEAIGLVQNDGFELPVTQTELAEVLGLSSVHVNRVLQSMRREGLISLQGGWVTVHDRERLEALASFDPSYLRA
jgi:CRP-like cAMP-binding protein